MIPLAAIVFFLMILLARELSYRLPMTSGYAILAIIICIVAGPLVGLGVGLGMNALDADDTARSPDYFTSGIVSGFLGSILAAVAVPIFHGKRRQAGA